MNSTNLQISVSNLIIIRNKRIQLINFIEKITQHFNLEQDIFFGSVYLLDCILSNLYIEEYTFEQIIIVLIHIVLKLEDDLYYDLEVLEIIKYTEQDNMNMESVKTIESVVCNLFDYNFSIIYNNIIHILNINELKNENLISILNKCILFPEMYKWNNSELLLEIENIFITKPINELGFFVTSVIGYQHSESNNDIIEYKCLCNSIFYDFFNSLKL